MSSDTYETPGLAADWLNGWLAALGITVLIPEAHLKWVRSPVPFASFKFTGDLAASVAASLPSLDEIDELSIARRHRASSFEMGRNVSDELFRDRAVWARARADLSLDVTVTDLASEEKSLAHCPLDPPAPKGLTLHERLRSTYRLLDADVPSMVRASLEGRGRRKEGNGLGFDHRRFPAGANPSTQPFIDPVVELLAFSGMALLPLRGDGRSGRARQRGWTDAPSHRLAFTWPTWHMYLDRWAIDALLDRFWALGSQRSKRLGDSGRRFGVTAAYGTIARRPKSTSDVSRGYASERIC